MQLLHSYIIIIIIVALQSGGISHTAVAAASAPSCEATSSHSTSSKLFDYLCRVSAFARIKYVINL